MLFILILLFFPCALVGAFVTADEHDLTITAFQTAGEFFFSEPLTGAYRSRSGATAPKNDVTSKRLQGSSCQGNPRKEDRVAAVSVSVVRQLYCFRSNASIKAHSPYYFSLAVTTHKKPPKHL